MADIFEEINSLVNVKQLIEYYYQPLRRDNKVICPFHNEKTGSLSVNEKDNMWKCFGCGAGGDGISFVAKYKNISQIDAAKLIASDFNLQVDFGKEEKDPSKLEIRRYILECQKNLEKTDYLQNRGLSLETLRFFGVGYDTKKKCVVIPYNRSYTYYQTRRVDRKEFYKPEKDKAGPEPIWNDTALYKKDTRPIFVVESPICAMSIMQYSGVAISICGKENKNKLVEFCKKIKPKAPLILSLDNDAPGQQANEELYQTLKEVDVKCVKFNVAGNYKDPNELLQKDPAKLCERIYQGNLQAKRVARGSDDLITAEDLYSIELEDLKWIVKGLIPEGLSILVAASKIGKSWLMMQLCNAIVERLSFLNKPTTHSGVLYFSLEDSDRRLKRRMNVVWKNKKPSPGVYFKTECKTLDTGLIDQLTRIVKAHKDIRVIIFDTFQKIRGIAMKNESAYAYDYREMGILKQFADRYGISIILVHHTRKMLDQDDVFNMTSGSTAIIGASDTALLIYKKKRGDEFATLNLTGRDVMEQEIVINRSQDQGIWSVVGSPEEQEAKHKEEAFNKNPIAMTLLKLYEKNPTTGWEGSVRQLANAYCDLTGEALPDTEANIGKTLNDYDFCQRIYKATKWEHSTRRRSNCTLHTFKPRQVTFFDRYAPKD